MLVEVRGVGQNLLYPLIVSDKNLLYPLIVSGAAVMEVKLCEYI